MNGTDLLKALGGIGEDLIDDAEESPEAAPAPNINIAARKPSPPDRESGRTLPGKAGKSRRRVYLLAAAAVALMLLGVSFFYAPLRRGGAARFGSKGYARTGLPPETLDEQERTEASAAASPAAEETSPAEEETCRETISTPAPEETSPAAVSEYRVRSGPQGNLSIWDESGKLISLFAANTWAIQPAGDRVYPVELFNAAKQETDAAYAGYPQEVLSGETTIPAGTPLFLLRQFESGSTHQAGPWDIEAGSWLRDDRYSPSVHFLSEEVWTDSEKGMAAGWLMDLQGNTLSDEEDVFVRIGDRIVGLTSGSLYTPEGEYAGRFSQDPDNVLDFLDEGYAILRQEDGSTLIVRTSDASHIAVEMSGITYNGHGGGLLNWVSGAGEFIITDISLNVKMTLEGFLLNNLDVLHREDCAGKQFQLCKTTAVSDKKYIILMTDQDDPEYRMFFVCDEHFRIKQSDTARPPHS